MNITRGTSSLKEILPLLNKAFHEDFPSLLPKLYSDGSYLKDHYLAHDDNGKLMGAAAAIPTKFIVGSHTLTARGIGMVGVSKSARGKGVMHAMLSRAVEDARAENVDFMFLSGNRKRYERYGFVPCNYLADFLIIKENVKHSECAVDLEFEKYDKARHTEEITRIYNSQYARYERIDMHKSITSWKNKRILIAKLNGKTVGYCIVKNMTINELALDGVSAYDFAINFFKKCCKIPVLHIQTYDTEHIKSLAKLAQKVDTYTDCCMCVLNYWNTVKTLLDAYPLRCDYECVLEIENNGKRLIKQTDGKTELTETDRTPDCRLSADIATMALFLPSVAYAYNLPFTLKLSITHNDNV